MQFPKEEDSPEQSIKEQIKEIKREIKTWNEAFERKHKRKATNEENDEIWGLRANLKDLLRQQEQQQQQQQQQQPWEEEDHQQQKQQQQEEEGAPMKKTVIEQLKEIPRRAIGPVYDLYEKAKDTLQKRRERKIADDNLHDRIYWARAAGPGAY